MINNLHHFEILTSSSSKLLNYFINGFKFKLVLTKQNGPFIQYLINSNSINFLITSVDTDNNQSWKRIKSTNQNDEEFIYSTPLSLIQSKHANLFKIITSKKDTVFNAAFQVRDLDRILYNCNRFSVPVIKKKHLLIDEGNKENGFVECAVISSCIDGVVHSLFNLNNYNGNFLPGYEDQDETSDQTSGSSPHLATHFDHLTYATPKNTSNSIIDWYKKIFNMKHFRINREETDGLIVKTGDSGMNLKAIRYWLCAETGVQFKPEIDAKNSKASLYNNDFKFVISEPLDNHTGDLNAVRSKSKNQISIFLDEHNGAGIQHIGLHTPDIVKSVQKSKQSCDQVKYYVTPDSYYKTVIYFFNGFMFFTFIIYII